MLTVDRSIVRDIHAAARRERAEYISCLFLKLALWIRTRLPDASPALRNTPCCQPV